MLWGRRDLELGQARSQSSSPKACGICPGHLQSSNHQQQQLFCATGGLHSAQPMAAYLGTML